MSSMISSKKPAGFRRGSLALAGMLAAALSAQAQSVSVLDDFEAKSNQNKFLGYSFFYNDAADGGTSTISTSSPGAKPTELLVDPLKSFDAGFNSPSALKLDFTYGANKPKSCGGTCAYGQMVGFGTQFIPGTDVATGTGTKLDLTGATELSFYAKASVAMKMRVEITTTNVTDFGYFRGDVSVGTDWTRLSILLSNGLGGIAQPSWALPVTFDPTLVQKLQFSISADDNTGLTKGTVWLDSIAVLGYKWVPPNACVPCVGTAAVTGAVLGDLEPATTPPRAANQNVVGGFWFAYNDVGTRTVAAQKDYSEIFEGVDATDPKVPILVVSPAKGAAASNGAYIKFTLGPSYLDGTNTVMPFVGIGTKTSDALETTALNATGATGVAFDYKTDAGSTFSYIRLEVKTKQTDLGTNAAAIHSVLLPATNGEWKVANIPWAKFSLPDWTEIPDRTAPVQITTITKFQWAVQDVPGTTGGFAIDNVKMAGLGAISVRKMGAIARGFRMHQADGRLDVAFELAAGIANAKVSLVDMKGSVVASRTVSGKGPQTAALETRNLRSGLYTLQIRQGNVVRGMQVTLLK
jgi:hypothetical protein